MIKIDKMLTEESVTGMDILIFTQFILDLGICIYKLIVGVDITFFLWLFVLMIISNYVYFRIITLIKVIKDKKRKKFIDECEKYNL